MLKATGMVARVKPITAITHSAHVRRAVTTAGEGAADRPESGRPVDSAGEPVSPSVGTDVVTATTILLES